MREEEDRPFIKKKYTLQSSDCSLAGDEEETFNVPITVRCSRMGIKAQTFLNHGWYSEVASFPFDAFYRRQLLISKPPDTKTRVFQHFVWSPNKKQRGID